MITDEPVFWGIIAALCFIAGTLCIAIPFIQFPEDTREIALYEGSYKTDWNPNYQIDKDSIKITEEGVFIPGDYYWAEYADTKSMLPLFGNKSIGIQVLVNETTSLLKGDIVSYIESNRTVAHRIIETGIDASGEWFILKGDNNPKHDPYIIRRSDIKRKLVGVIY